MVPGAVHADHKGPRLEPGMSEFWYNALNSAKQRGGDAEPSADVTAAPTPPRPASDQPIGEDLAAFLRLQSTELQRLSQTQQDLVNRLDTVLHVQKQDRVLLQNLQEQVESLADRVKGQTPAIEPSVISQEVRNGVTADLQPILVAVVELLELAMRVGSAPPHATSAGADGEVSPGEDFRRLPDILTRSLDELPIDGGSAGKRSATEFIRRAVASLAQPSGTLRRTRPDSFSLTRVPS